MTVDKMRRLRQRLKVFLAVCATFLLFGLTSTTAANAAYYSAGMWNNVLCMKPLTVNSTWASAINNGRNAWNNNSYFTGNLYQSSSCVSNTAVGSYGSDWFGYYNPITQGTSFRIRLDSTNLNAHINQTGYTWGNVVKSTTAHEYGHALRLAHTTNQFQLMSHNRIRNTVTGPTSGEVGESNSYY